MHDHFMSLITKLAIGSEGVTGTRMAACVVYKNRVISFGLNRLKSHPFQQKFSKNSDSIYLHAETDAIKNALRFVDVDDLKKSTLYICRIKKISKKDCWGLSKPCSGCQKAISTFGIKNVIYSNDEGGYSKL